MSAFLKELDIKPVNFWLWLGLMSQFLFFLRFFIQWIISEIKKSSVIPVVFWYFSIFGSVGLLAYSIHKRDPVFILGQSMGIVIYLRNIVLRKRG